MITALKWFWALTKRLFKHPSFVLTLLLIPLCVFAVNVSSRSEHGVLTIAIAGYDVNDEAYNQLLTDFLTNDSVINFYECETVDKAKNDVVFENADCAWVFAPNLSQKLLTYTTKEDCEPLCEVYIKEDTVFTRVAREKLYGILLNKLSVNYSYDFITKRVEADRRDVEIIHNDERSYFNSDFLKYEFLDTPEITIEQSDYMTAPLRGLLSAAFTVCVLAAMMLSLKDENDGRYSFFPSGKRLMLHITSCLSGGVISILIMVCSLFTSGVNVSTCHELILAFLFLLATVGFCTFLGVIFSSVKSFSFVLPTVIALICVLCPVFLTVNSFKLVQVMIPAYHYLNGVFSSDGVINLVLYCMIVYPLSAIVYRMKSYIKVCWRCEVDKWL